MRRTGGESCATGGWGSCAAAEAATARIISLVALETRGMVAPQFNSPSDPVAVYLWSHTHEETAHRVHAAGRAVAGRRTDRLESAEACLCDRRGRRFGEPAVQIGRASCRERV